ncbi:MAG: zinc ribbon domain-containing protein [Dysgonamonadaceae bacterium]|jgi:uncharacterized membrane protein YvbJ|nr:zinc ribbon domain-containing protein [Dysgonamonadaceae bacterium]
MFCSNCGAEVSEKAVVCVKCGVSLKNEFVQPVQQTVRLAIAGLAISLLGLIEIILITAGIFASIK